MKIEQIYTGCLAQGAYYIESDGEAAIIDPLRETEQYIRKAAADHARIRYIFETHFHADFVSGHLDLAKKTGAEIIYGPKAETSFAIRNATDGESFRIGRITLTALHTPGHTLESTTYLLRDETGKDICLFTGDTLFIGDVGRPDLAIKQDLSSEDLAGMLYDSLRSKILPLADDIVVYPAHGAGSACGKSMSKETWDTLGHQKQVNYALRAGLTREDFIREVTDGILPPPQYFAKNAMINKTGYEPLETVLERGAVPLDVDTFESIANHEGAIVLDTRSAEEFAKGHIPNSVFIGIDGTFAPWVGALITDMDQAIIFLSPPGMEQDVVTRLSRVGYDNTLGYLSGGIESWSSGGKEIATIESIPATEMVRRIQSAPSKVLDVRRPAEYSGAHLDGAENVPLDFINEEMNHVSKNDHYFVHCAGGYRSMIFISILQARGYDNLINVEGGWSAISKLNVPVAAGE